MILAVSSLIVLVLVVVLANVRKLNLGLVAVCGAVLLGVAGGLAPGDIVSGFNTKLFIQSLGMCTLVVIAKDNGTLSYMAQKIMQVGCGRAIKLLPIFLYFALVAAEFMGMNLFSLVVPLLVALAFEMKMDVLKVSVIGLLSMLGGGQALFASPGLFLNAYVADAGIDIQGWNISILATIAYTGIFFVTYFLFGWYKEKPIDLGGREKPKLTKYQVWTLLSFVALVIGTIGFQLDLMVIPMAAVVVLMSVGACEPKEVVKRIPYETLLMIAGMTMLTGVMRQVGGTEVLANAITAISNNFLIKPLLSGVCSAMSVIASASTVVQPTMIPMLPMIAEEFPAVSIQGLVAAVGIGSYATAISPMSSSGLQVMAAYDAVYQPDEKSRLKLFNRILLLSVINAGIQLVLSAVGYYGIQIIR